MSVADEILSKYFPEDYKDRPTSVDAFGGIKRKTEEDEPGYFSQGLHAVGSVLGAPKAGIDWLARQGAKAQGLNVGDDATVGSMLRAGLGFSQGDEGYAGRLAGKAIEFGGDVAADPLTWAMGGLGKVVRAGETAGAAIAGASRLAPEALGALAPESLAAAAKAARVGRFASPVQKGASAAFTGLMGAGALQEGGSAVNTYRREGFTPKAAEETFGAALSGLGAAAGAAHFLPHKAAPVVADPTLAAIRAATDSELQARHGYYTKKGMAREAQMAAFERASRESKKAQAGPDFSEEFTPAAPEAAPINPSGAFERDVRMEEAQRVPWAQDTLETQMDRWSRMKPHEIQAELDKAVTNLEEASARAATPADSLTDRSLGAPESDVATVAGRDRAGMAAAQDAAPLDAGVSAAPVAPDAGQPATRLIEVSGEQRQANLTPEQAAAWDTAEAKYRETSERIKADRNLYPDEKAKRLKALGMQFAAEKRQISGELTAKESAAKATSDARLRAGDNVTDAAGVPYEVLEPAAFGKVRVRDAEGKEWRLPHGDLTKQRISEAPESQRLQLGDPEANRNMQETLARASAEGGTVLPFEPTPEYEALRRANAERKDLPLPPAFQQLQAEALKLGLDPNLVTQAMASPGGRETLRRVMNSAKGTTPEGVEAANQALPTVSAGAESPAGPRAQLEARILKERPGIDRGVLKTALDEVEAGKREVEPTVKALMDLDPRYGPAPFRGWEGRIFDERGKGPTPIPGQAEAVAQAGPEGDWIKDAAAAEEAAVAKRTTDQEGREAKKAKIAARHEAAARELGLIPERETPPEAPPLAEAPKYSTAEKPTVTEEGQPLFKTQDAATGEPGGGLTFEQIRSALPSAKFEPHPDGGYSFTLPGNRRGRILPNADIEFDVEAFRKGYKREPLPGEAPVGSFQRMGPEVIIRLAKHAEEGTVHHEAFHAAMDMALTNKQKRAILKQYGSEEAAADAYGKWKPGEVAHSLFQRIADFFSRIYRAFAPTWESTFKAVRSGEAYEPGLLERGAAKVGDLLSPERVPTTEGTQYGEPTFATNVKEPVQQPIPGIGAEPVEVAPEKPGLGAMVREGYTAGLIGPGSQVANIAGGIGEQGARVGETLTASLIDRMLPGDRQRFAGEARHELKGFVQQLRPALSKLGSDLKDIATLAPEKVDPGAPIERREGAIPGKFGRLVRHNFRMLGAFDNFIGMPAKQAEVNRLAYRQARMEMKGAPAAAIEARAAEIQANPSEALVAQAEKAKASRLFRSDPNNPGKILPKLMELRRDFPILYGVLPFLETPGNIAKLTLDRSPVGFVKAARAYRAFEAARKKGATPETVASLRAEAVDAIARPLFGTAVLGAFGALAAEGGLTGGGPTDKKLLSQKKNTGWQPYSFVVPGAVGRKTYIPFSRFEPVSSLLGFAADIAEAPNSKDASALFDKALGSFAANWLNKTYFSALAGAIEAANNPKQALGQYATNLAGSIVPNTIGKVATAIDPIVRDTSATDKGWAGVPERMLNAVIADVPGLSKTLPSRRTSTGEDLERSGNPLSRFLSPVQVTSDKPEAGLERLLGETEFAPSQPGRDITIPRTGGKSIRLNDAEYRLMQDANKQAADYLRANESKLARMDAEARKKQIQRVYDRARDSARERLFKNPTFRSRVRQEIAVR